LYQGQAAGPGLGGTETADLTGDPSGWRFQMRLPTGNFGADSGLAGAASMLRAQLGPRSRSEAKRLALQLASMCQAICSAAAGLQATMSTSLPGNTEERHVIEVCQQAIGRAIAQPSEAIGLAQGLGSALTSPQLVQREVEKGAAGATAVTANAEALTRQALTDVLKLSSQPAAALAALAAVAHVAPKVEDLCAAPSPAARLRSEPDRVLPLFSEISQAYIDKRIARDGADHADIPILTLRRQVFLDVIGDRTPDKYYPRDLHRRAAGRRSGAPSLIRRTISGGSAENAGDRKARPTIRRAP
jgi:hypothetical protein